MAVRLIVCFTLDSFVAGQLCGQLLPPADETDAQRESAFLFQANSLPGTILLTEEEDLADKMLSGIDAFLLEQIQQARIGRELKWRELTDWMRRAQLDSSAVDNKQLEAWLQARRNELSRCLGLRDERISPVELEILHTTLQDGTLGWGEFSSVAMGQAGQDRPFAGDAGAGETEPHWRAWAVRWPVLDGVTAEGIFIEPVGINVSANVVVVPDADQTPEQVAGLAAGLSESMQIARSLASAGCRVLVPTLIDRSISARGPPGQPGRAELTNREFVYRPAFELGRHVLGYEVQKVLSAIDWLDQHSKASQLQTDPAAAASDPSQQESVPVTESPVLAVAGYGEGGGIALLCSALDRRIEATYVKGAFGPRDAMWREPICRNLFGFLNTFSDAELAALIWPRGLVLDFAPGPQVAIRSREGAPGDLRPHAKAIAAGEFARTAGILGIDLLDVEKCPQEPQGAMFSGDSSDFQARWLFAPEYPGGPEQAAGHAVPSAFSELPKPFADLMTIGRLPPVKSTLHHDENRSNERQSRQVKQLIRHTQVALVESSQHRHKILQSLDTSSLHNYEKSTDPLRKQFYQEVIGQFEIELLPLAARTRKCIESDQWIGYEVVLDVWPDVFAFGILLVPKDLAPGDQRPVVVCQHGLEGRPMDVIQGDHPAYHDFAARLCERGYIVFAPQNPYLQQDRFRSLQRKANSLGKTLFSMIIPQHQQILNWLKTLAYVDPDRIAFYGLSYGGKSAMRIPAILRDYCLSICSADFNEWIVKNASTTEPFSYVWTGEYEIFEYNLGNTFGYAEMASLICPRPFMVERGHFDAVATDPWVGYEYAKVLNLYQARLGIGSLTEIEWFPGPHTINGKGTFEFLDRQLQFSPR